MKAACWKFDTETLFSAVERKVSMCFTSDLIWALHMGLNLMDLENKLERNNVMFTSI